MIATEPRTNETWLADLRSHGAGQQAALVELRQALLRGLSKALSGSDRVDEAFLEDVVQDALILILDRLAQFEGRSRFVTWATAIAIRKALGELRRRRWKDVSLDEVTAETGWAAEEGSGQPEQDSRWQHRSLVSKMYEVIGRDLTERQRAALLAELKGMPQEEIARHLGSNRNAIYKLTHDARKRLKQGLEAAGYGPEDVQSAFNPGGAGTWP